MICISRPAEHKNDIIVLRPTIWENDMLKDKLLNAVKVAADAYNGGMPANDAVAKAAADADFNEKQAERLVEMFNTSAALSQEKSASDPTGSCELADKAKVAKIMLDCDAVLDKSASARCDADYSFYGTVPGKTSKAIAARKAGVDSMMKAAFAPFSSVKEPEELCVSKDSTYLIISRDIDMLKQASDAADDVIGALNLEVERGISKIANFANSAHCTDDMLGMIWADGPRSVIEKASSFSPRLKSANGDKYNKMSVYDNSSVEDVLKIAEEVSSNMNDISRYEEKRCFYLKKAEDAKSMMRSILGITRSESQKSAEVSDMFDASRVSHDSEEDDPARSVEREIKIASDISAIMKKASISPEEVSKVLEGMEKGAAKSTWMVNTDDAIDALAWAPSVGGSKKRIENVRRAMILADLMTNDPIISEADPSAVTSTYKTMVMTAPRVSLDPAQVRAFLRVSLNSNAISPNEAKILADVDKGTRISNIDTITNRDSSIRDSNEYA